MKKVEFYNSIQTFADTTGHNIDVKKCMSIKIINQSQSGELYIGASFFLYPQSSLTIDGHELEKYNGPLNLILDPENAVKPYFIVIKKLQINEATIQN